MRFSILLATLILVAIFNACEVPEEPAAQSADPEIFAPGVVSTNAPEFATTFAPDGQTVYFNRTSADRSSLAILRSQRIDGAWQDPDTASFSGTWFDVDPFVAPDGARLYFSSNRPATAEDTLNDFNTWVVSLSDEEEGEPMLLPEPVNSDSADVFVSATVSGALYFSSHRDGVTRTYRASSAEPDAEVEIVAIDMNLDGGVGNPAVSPDEKHLAFVSRNDIGGADIYVSSRSSEGWSPARRLQGPINSSFTDFAPSWSPDGAYLYFTSERPGVMGPTEEGVRPPGDIYRVSAEAVFMP